MSVDIHRCLSPLPLFGLLNHSRSYLQVSKHYHVLNETQVRGWAGITIHYHTLTERGISAAMLLKGSHVYVWKFYHVDEACVHGHTRRYTNTHPHTQLTPQRCMGPPAKRALCVLVINTAPIILPPISLQWIRHCILEFRKRSNRHTHTHTHTHNLQLHGAWHPALDFDGKMAGLWEVSDSDYTIL